MSKKKILFVCREGMNRSPTAYDIYKDKHDCFYTNYRSNFGLEEKVQDWLFDITIFFFKPYRCHRDPNSEIFYIPIEDNYKRGDIELIKRIKEGIALFIPGGL